MKHQRRSQSEIQSILRAFRSSGLSRAKFCQKKYLSVATLGFWLRKDREAGEAGEPKVSRQPKSNFVPVPIPSPQAAFSSGHITVRLANECIIEFPSNIHPAQLAQFVSALEDTSC